MAIICETSAILNGCYTAIKPIEVAACDDTCFFLGAKYKEQTKQLTINLRHFINRYGYGQKNQCH